MTSMPFTHYIAVCLLAFGVAVASAGELKVDINRDGKNTSAQTAQGYVQWTTDATGGTSSTGTTPITRSFVVPSTAETVTVSFAMTAAAQSAGGTGLTYTYDATGTTTEGQKLVSDGVTVDPRLGNVGGEILMTVTGLDAGDHSLLTFHNVGDSPTDPALGSLAPIEVFLNGSYVTTFTPSIRSTDVATPTVYLNFTTSSPSDVTTVLFAADSSSGATTRNAVINGFEIDTPNSTRIANTPSPADGDEHVDADSGGMTLSWLPDTAGVAVSHDIYFGTSLPAVKDGTHASPEFKGNQAGTTYPVSGLSSMLTYYWRVDEIDSLGNSTKGTVWYFRPRHLAFPDAEGYGRFARGGRGGRVVHVTSLADYTSSETPIPGTLRFAIIEETGPRTIVFDVSGIITLESRLVLSSPYVTIAGQTAPGKGICLKKWTMGMSGADDAIIRFIRSRPGRTLQSITVDHYKNGTPGAPIMATAAVSVDGMGMQGSSHSIIDHCSISWTIDEAFSSRSAKNITLQRTLISEALNKALHPNYIFLDDLGGTEHGYAASVGGDIGSFHHNVLAHCYGRNWSMAGGLDTNANFAGRLDFTNNVVYNWGSRTTDGGAMEVDFVGNYYRPGAGTTLVPWALTMNHEDDFGGSQRCHFSGNVMPGYFDESNQTAGRRSVVSNGVPTPPYETFVASPFFPSFVTTQSALGASMNVLSDVGCNQPILDDHDARVIRETVDGTYTYSGSVTGKPGFPDVETDVGGWETYPEEYRRPDWDTDDDGLPDWLERLLGTNPNSTTGDFSESNDDTDDDGYTAIEDYLNWMAAPHAATRPEVAIGVDLAPFGVGFAGPGYSVSGATGGNVVLQDGHIAVFTPANGFIGLAGFDFTVSGGGTSVTRRLGVAVASETIFELRWKGAAGAVWDGTSADGWFNGSTVGGFQPGFDVLFGESNSADENVALSGSVLPGSVMVNGATNYTFTGAGTISGTGTLTKSGSGTLTLGDGHAFAGVEVNGGAIEIDGGVLTVNGDVTNNGTIRLTGGATLAVSGTFVNNGVLDLLTGSQDLPANFVNNGVVIFSTEARVKGVERSGSTFSVTIAGHTGHTYQLQHSTSLTSGTWKNVGPPQPGDGGGPLTLTDHQAAETEGFYRIVISP